MRATFQELEIEINQQPTILQLFIRVGKCELELHYVPYLPHECAEGEQTLNDHNIGT